jgi:hypothetical protein
MITLLLLTNTIGACVLLRAMLNDVSAQNTHDIRRLRDCMLRPSFTDAAYRVSDIMVARKAVLERAAVAYHEPAGRWTDEPAGAVMTREHDGRRLYFVAEPRVLGHAS